MMGSGYPFLRKTKSVHIDKNDAVSDNPRMKRILLLGIENCLHSSVTGFYDILTVANRMAVASAGVPLFDPVIVTPDGQPVTCFNGLVLTPQRALEKSGPTDLLYLPVIYGELEPMLENQRLIEDLFRLFEQKTVMTAVCAGVFLLARTGALDRRQATTHWNLVREFRALFPRVCLKPEKMLVDEGDIITAGGVTAYMDLALYLIGRFGSRELAALVSKSLLIDPVRTTQAPYTGLLPTPRHGDPAVLKLQEWMQDHFSEPLTLTQMAVRAELEPRTLARRFKKSTGDTPLEYLQRLRLASARTLLETSPLSVDQITWEVGYQDVSSFRRLFKQRTGLSPTAYRKRFGMGEMPP